jgi:rhamnulokinase
MSRLAHLALDLGAESGRAVLGSIESGSLSTTEVHRFSHRPLRFPEGLRWDITGLWREILAGIARGAEAAREAGLTLASIGVDCWGVDFALLGPKGELLALPRCYRDPANLSAMKRVLSLIPERDLYAATGIQTMALNTIFQLDALRHDSPDLLSRARTLLFLPDLFHHWLGGPAQTERSIASTSQLLEPASARWATPILQRLGLPLSLFPDPGEPAADLGELHPWIAREVGLPPGVRIVRPTGHDTACAVAAIPAVPGGSWAFLSSGTWSLLGVEIQSPIRTDEAFRVPFTNELGLGGTVRFLKNIAGLWLVQECRRAWAAAGTDLDYPELTRLAESEPPLRTLVDTQWGPFALPGDMPQKIAAFASQTNQPVPRTPGQFTRTCLDSLALAYHATLRNLEGVLGRSIDRLHLVGGGSRNALLTRMTADATGIPVFAGPEEATAAGNILMQAMGMGIVRDPAHLRQISRQTTPPRRVDPDPSAASLWSQAASRYDDLVRRSRALAWEGSST